MTIHKTTHTTSTAPQLHTLSHNQPLFLVPRNFRNIALTEHICTRHSYTQSPIQHILTQQSNMDDTHEQIIEQPHTTNFHSQINYIFSPR